MQNDPAFALSARILQTAAASPSRAEKELKSALKAHPKSPHLHFAAGLVALQQKNQKDARNHFIRAINTGSASAGAYLNAALIEAELGQLPRALELLDRASARFPNDDQLATTAIKLCLQTQDYAQAQSRLEAASAQGTSEEISFLTGRLHEALGNLPAAINAFEAAGEKPQAKAALSLAYAFTNQEDKALAAAKAGLALAPEDAALRENLAWRQLESGAFAEAAKSLQSLLNAPAQRFEALRALTNLPEAQDMGLEAITQTLSKEARSPIEKGHVAMAEAHLAQKRGDTERYLSSLAAANASYAKARRYDHAADAATQAQVFDTYDTHPAAESAPLSPTPIFVTGMIRSGTTLLERLLAASPEVASMGEVAAVTRHFRAALPNGLPDLPALRAAYSALQTLLPAAPFTVDKMPANALYLGWILRTFPNAKLIVMERDLRDVAASAYSAYFNGTPMNFTFREDWLMQKIALYNDQIAGWEARSVPFLRVSYENLARDPQTTLAEVTAYCGLRPLDVADLSQATGTIRTASFAQARRPVNTASIGRWRNFQTILPKLCRED